MNIIDKDSRFLLIKRLFLGKRIKYQKVFILIFLFGFFFSQSASAGFFDPNPQSNFKEADYLMGINRPIAADKLINDVMVFCAKKDDESCLAEAYYYFGKLLMWRGADTDKWYKFMSYVEKDITTDNIHQKSMEYFEKALALAKKHEMNDTISAMYIKIGILKFTYFKDQISACDSFDKSLQYNLIFQRTNPDRKVVLDKGFNSFEEYILRGKKEMGCLK